ncbi:Uncharacterised protein [Budvicia aquatica]|uniref:Uncharacterized protein n=1 Tax=Budvicia aquatica TaxID=82979 RepID=A0A485A088_9GAMM|nr:Uncharacterised protein [Budvicia aquatica]
MSQMLALLLIVAILYIGDAISVRTKAWIPSVFVCAVLFLIGYWTFFPKDIVSVAGIGTPGCSHDDVFAHYEYGHIAFSQRIS